MPNSSNLEVKTANFGFIVYVPQPVSPTQYAVAIQRLEDGWIAHMPTRSVNFPHAAMRLDKDPEGVLRTRASSETKYWKKRAVPKAAGRYQWLSFVGMDGNGNPYPLFPGPNVKKIMGAGVVEPGTIDGMIFDELLKLSEQK